MREIDKKLAEALQVDDETLFPGDAKDESIFTEMLDSFHGRRGWLVWLVWFWGLVFAVLMFGGAIMFFRSEAEPDRLMWGLICIFGMVGNGLLKTWYWMELNRNTTLREIKRVEFQVARLAQIVTARLPEQPGGQG